VRMIWSLIARFFAYGAGNRLHSAGADSAQAASTSTRLRWPLPVLVIPRWIRLPLECSLAPKPLYGQRALRPSRAQVTERFTINRKGFTCCRVHSSERITGTLVMLSLRVVFKRDDRRPCRRRSRPVLES
jgi:hypothetical protein